MGQVVALMHEEGVRLDAARLVGLVTRMGDAGAERLVARTLERMEECLTRLEDGYADGNLRVISREAGKLEALATEVGMTSLARVTGDMSSCAARGDMVAFAATIARLRRIADRSLGAMGALRDSAV